MEETRIKGKGSGSGGDARCKKCFLFFLIITIESGDKGYTLGFCQFTTLTGTFFLGGSASLFSETKRN